MFVGVGARRVRDLFKAAKQNAPCIVFIDEIDAVGAARNPKDQQNTRMTLNQLLTELDGFKASEGVIVLAATNTPGMLDKALIRPGRFDRTVSVPNPDVGGRREILQAHAKGVKMADNVDFDVVARRNRRVDALGDDAALERRVTDFFLSREKKSTDWYRYRAREG